MWEEDYPEGTFDEVEKMIEKEKKEKGDKRVYPKGSPNYWP